jgi:hypothetical protein
MGMNSLPAPLMIVRGTGLEDTEAVVSIYCFVSIELGDGNILTYCLLVVQWRVMPVNLGKERWIVNVLCL